LSSTTVLEIQRGNHLAPKPLPAEDDQKHLAEPIDCVGCGELIYIVPCRICGARRYQQAMREHLGVLATQPKPEPRRVPTRPFPDRETLSLELDGDEQRRLEQVRDRRRGLGHDCA
jgi:hypothetical protein